MSSRVSPSRWAPAATGPLTSRHQQWGGEPRGAAGVSAQALPRHPLPGRPCVGRARGEGARSLRGEAAPQPLPDGGSGPAPAPDTGGRRRGLVRCRLRAGVRPRRRPHGRGEQRGQEPAPRPAFPPSLPEIRPRPCGRARPRRVKRLRAPVLRHGALGPPGRSAPPVRAPVTETPGSTRPRPVCGRSSPCESVPPTRGDPSPCASAVLPSVLRLVTASLPAVPASPWPSRRGLRTPSRCGWTPRPSSSLVWLRNPDGSPHSPGPRRPPPVPPAPKKVFLIVKSQKKRVRLGIAFWNSPQSVLRPCALLCS